MSHFKKILLLIDGSDTADKALRMALDMARESLASVRFIHVIDDDRYFSRYELSSDLPPVLWTRPKNCCKTPWTLPLHWA